jgi:RND family efflux transporter MFP subunit
MRVSVQGISILGAALILAGCGKKDQTIAADPVPVKAETVATQEIRTAWRYSGQIEPDTQVQLAFKQPGYVAALQEVTGVDGRWREVQVGDEIRSGAVLACLRRSDYEAALNTAAGQEGSTQGALGTSQAELEQAKADQTKANLDFERAQALYAVHAMTRPDYDAAAANHTATAAKVAAAIRQIEARQGQLRAAHAQVTSARISLSDTNLITPMPGVIIEKNVERGSLVAAGTSAFTLADTRVVKMEFGVPDNMLPYLMMGAAVPVEVEPLQGRTLTGRITEIAASANRDSRVFNIQVSLPNRDHSLKVGMIASVRLEQADPQSVPLVPVTALMTAQSGSSDYSVFTLKEEYGKQFAKLQRVRIGQTIGRSVAINEGLIPGERIIVNRTNQLNDGTQVRIIE